MQRREFLWGVTISTPTNGVSNECFGTTSSSEDTARSTKSTLSDFCLIHHYAIVVYIRINFQDIFFMNRIEHISAKKNLSTYNYVGTLK